MKTDPSNTFYKLVSLVCVLGFEMYRSKATNNKIITWFAYSTRRIRIGWIYQSDSNMIHIISSVYVCVCCRSKRAEFEQQRFILERMSYAKYRMIFDFDSYYLVCVRVYTLTREQSILVNNIAPMCIRKLVQKVSKQRYMRHTNLSRKCQITQGQEKHFSYSSHVTIDIWVRWWKCDFTLALRSLQIIQFWEHVAHTEIDPVEGVFV